MKHERFARVRGTGISEEAVTAYLPENYEVLASGDGWVDIAGYDNSGWTLDGYVIPRLQSGLYSVKETTNQDFWDDLAVTEAIERKHGLMSLADECAMEYERY
jgi:hypothetical protein